MNSWRNAVTRRRNRCETGTLSHQPWEVAETEMTIGFLRYDSPSQSADGGTMPLENGSRLNHYEVVAFIGAGGMGEVYRATDTKLHRQVALKVLPVQVAADPERRDRFTMEARAVAALNHPHIVTIYSVEESDGVHFLTMEFVEGRTLAAEFAAGGHQSAEQFLAAAVPLAEAVAAAHAAGITHRDLKPQNVMVGRDGRLKVLDFGLAKFGRATAAGDALSDLSTMVRTRHGVVVGTVPYMSPEQLEGRAVDARSDIFSLGVMFYEMATGRRPFAGDSDVALAVAILRDQPAPVATLAPFLPLALHEVIQRCLTKNPEGRYQDGAALHRALRDIEVHARTAGVNPIVDVSRPRPDAPPLVGRHTEHDKLATHLRDAVSGAGALVLLGGEPGVGKTRLAEEVLEDARDHGMLVMTGRCYEAGTSPFSPFIEMFEQMLREVPAPALRSALGPDAADIARLVPKMRRVWADLPEPSQLEPEQQRRVLFSAVLDFFRRLSGAQPAALLLDDLHWADEATVALLQHLAPHLSALPVLCLGTYRDVDVDVGTPFEKAMAMLVRQKHAFRVPVRCLPQSAVAELLTAIGGSEPPPALVETVFHQTEGNPFFVGEVFKHLSEEGRLFDGNGKWQIEPAVDTPDVPEGVRIVIGRRLIRLRESTQALLTTAAVVGRQFELRLVEALSTFDGDAFLEAIEEAEASKLIASDRGGRQPRYTFTHELIRSTLLTALSLPRRQRLHARVADAMEAIKGSSLTGHAAAIAHHLYEAGPVADETRTIRFLILAADHAMEAGAVEGGLAHLERALSLVRDDDPETRATLLWKFGLAHRSHGQLTAAIQDWESALQLRETGADHAAIAALCLELTHSYVWTAQPALGALTARRGLAAVGPEVSSSRCRLLGSWGWSLSMAGDFEAADPIMHDALAMADTLGDVQRGELLLLTSWHYYLCMRRREQADACRQASDLLRPTRDLAKIGEALVNLQMASIQIGRPGDVARTEEEVRTIGERLGRFDIKVLRWYSETQRDWLIGGDLDHLDAGLRHVVEVAGAWRWLAEGSQAQALLWRGRLEAAREQAQVSFDHEPKVGTLTGIGWGMVFLCECAAGRREPALALLAEHAEGLPRVGRLNTLGSWTAVFKVIEGLAMLGEHERAATFYPLVVEALAMDTVVTFDASHLLETLAGIAAAAGRRWDVAEAHYQRAIRLAEGMPFISEQAEPRYWYARMRIDRHAPGDRREARAFLEAALAVYRRIGMPWHIQRSEALMSDTRE